MALLEANITLDEAILKSASMTNKGYMWLIRENILNVEVPENCTFESISVFWYSFTDFCAAVANFTSDDDTVQPMTGLNDKYGQFINLIELRNTHPKLFKVTGEFGVLFP